MNTSRRRNKVEQALNDDLSTLYTEPTGLFHLLVAAAGLDKHTDFCKRDMREMDFTDADLRGFNFFQSDLRGTSVRHAGCLDNTTNLEDTQLDPKDQKWLMEQKHSVYWQETKPSPNSLEGRPTVGDSDPPFCPYPGLTNFQANDADRFFGREIMVERLVDAVNRQRATALTGPSGSGKTSVVLAGLRPRLEATGAWRVVYVRIEETLESNPIMWLVRALVPLNSTADTDIPLRRSAAQLSEGGGISEYGLGNLVADLLDRDKGKRLLVIVDDFECVLTLIEDETARNKLIKLLFDDLLHASPDVRLLLVLRDDFVWRLRQLRALSDTLGNHACFLPPLNQDELRMAIVEPAANSGVLFEHGLVERLIDDASSADAALPLLQTALCEMWRLREGRTITSRSYERSGGAESIISERMEEFFRSRNPADNAKLRRLFGKLMTGPGGVLTRRVVPRRELPRDLWLFAKSLVADSLVTINTSKPSEATVEIAHDALIYVWRKVAAMHTKGKVVGESHIKSARRNVGKTARTAVRKK